MRKLICVLSLLVAANAVSAQTMISSASPVVKLPALDKSPMDMAYFPVNYPVLKIQDKATAPLVARVIYSRPQKSGRSVFGELVEYGKVWRLGANEATEIEFFRDVKIGNKKVLKGKYTIYALVNTSEWTFILNKETDVWGAFKYDEKKDVARITVPVQKAAEPAEAFSLVFEKTPIGMDLIVAWDDITVAMPVSTK